MSLTNLSYLCLRRDLACRSAKGRFFLGAKALKRFTVIILIEFKGTFMCTYLMFMEGIISVGKLKWMLFFRCTRFTFEFRDNRVCSSIALRSIVRSSVVWSGDVEPWYFCVVVVVKLHRASSVGVACRSRSRRRRNRFWSENRGLFISYFWIFP